MKKSRFLALCIASALSVSCTSQNTKEKISVLPEEDTDEKNFLVLEPFEHENELVIPFNTTVRLQTTNKTDLDMLADSFTETMLLFSKQMDSYHSYKDEGFSNVYDINDSYGTEEKVYLTKDLYDLLELGKELTVLSKGKFNITIGSLYDQWSSLFSTFPIVNDDPAPQDIQQSLGCVVDFDKLDTVLELDSTTQSVTFHAYEGCASQVKINLGAIAKGYSAERVKNILAQYEVPFLINCGTSSIVTYVPENMDKTYYIGIRDPYARIYTLFDYRIEGSGILTTSGDDSNYFLKETEDGTILRHHILDAETGYPNNYIRSSTVFASANGAAMDALSTALFNAKDSEERKDLVTAFENYLGTSIEWSYFVETGEKSGTLYGTNHFYEQIEPDSYSEYIRKKEIIQ